MKWENSKMIICCSQLITWLCLIHLNQAKEKASEIEAEGTIKKFLSQELSKCRNVR